jgi:Mg2+ and Co2+ transporter CorA
VIFFVIPILAGTEASPELDYVSFFCREDLLLTMHRKPVLQPQELATLEASDAWLPERSIAGLVSALMMDQSLDCLRHTAALRDAVAALEERMDRDADSVEAEEILEQRSALMTLGALASDQLPCVQALSKTERPFFRPEQAREYVSCALTNLQAADGSLSWLDQRIAALHSAFQMHAQDKTNRRLNMLTILSAIFMPSTLLAGIWGMNFQIMPELKYPFAYPLALGFMAVVGTGMYLFFRRTGWLD